jgi:hypothetical protein
MPELLDIMLHLPSGWALIALIIALCVTIVGLLMYLVTPPLMDDDGGW